MRRVASASTLAELVRIGRRYVESSFIYRWFTTEPEPEVIVIDLRETWTVGPVIWVVDLVTGGLETGMRTSIVAKGVGRLASSVRRRPIRAASLVVLLATVGSLLVVIVTNTASEQLVLAHVVVAAFAAIGLRSRSSLAELLETRIVRTLVAAVAPPEPPEAVGNHDGGRDDEHR